VTPRLAPDDRVFWRGIWSGYVVVILVILVAVVYYDCSMPGAVAAEPCQLPRDCEDPLLVTPRCDDDLLLWSPVPDADLAEYVVREYADPNGEPTLLGRIPVGTERLPVGCRDEARRMRIWASDLSGNESAEAAECDYLPGKRWDCVEETRPTCPGTCRRVCDVRDIEGNCVEAHDEPPGCVWCRPPINGLEAWGE